MHKFYDMIRPSLLMQFLSVREVDLGVIAALLRLQYCVAIALDIGGQVVLRPRRTRGLLTGTRTAVTLGRIPVEDCLSVCLEQWQRAGFEAEGGFLTVATWVDNLFTVGPTAYCAVSLLEDLESEFEHRWSLKYGATSKQLMSCKGALDVTIPEWKACQTFPVLGHLLSPENSTVACWSETKKALWRSFWRNAGVLDRCTTLDRKLILLRRCTLPRLEFVCPRWPFSLQRAAEITSLQVKMISKLARIPKNRGEIPKEYFNRRDQECQDIAVRCGAWAKIWCHKLLNWGDHLERDRNSRSWAYRLYHTQNASWLQACRAQFVCATRTIWAGATNTRLLAERP